MRMTHYNIPTDLLYVSSAPLCHSSMKGGWWNPFRLKRIEMETEIMKNWNMCAMFLYMCDICASVLVAHCDSTFNLHGSVINIFIYVKSTDMTHPHVHLFWLFLTAWRFAGVDGCEPTVSSEDCGWITWYTRTEIVALSRPAVVVMTGTGHF